MRQKRVQIPPAPDGLGCFHEEYLPEALTRGFLGVCLECPRWWFVATRGHEDDRNQQLSKQCSATITHNPFDTIGGTSVGEALESLQKSMRHKPAVGRASAGTRSAEQP